MASVNKKGYVDRRSQGSRGGNRTKAGKIRRDWWFVKVGTSIKIPHLYIPARYQGKRIKLKIEVVKEKNKK